MQGPYTDLSAMGQALPVQDEQPVDGTDVALPMGGRVNDSAYMAQRRKTTFLEETCRTVDNGGTMVTSYTEEKTMKKTEVGVARAAAIVGAWMFVSGALIFGPLGFALLCGITYAMYLSNLALGIICALLLFSPLICGAFWVTLLGASLIAERYFGEEPATEPAEVTS